MPWWPWRRRAEPPADATDRHPAGPVSSAPQRPRGWEQVTPLQRVAAAMPMLAPVERLTASLSSWTDPSFLAPLGHVVDPSGPSGTVDGLVRPAAPVTGLPSGGELPLRVAARGGVPVQRRTSGGTAVLTGAATAGPSVLTGPAAGTGDDRGAPAGAPSAHRAGEEPGPGPTWALPAVQPPTAGAVPRPPLTLARAVDHVAPARPVVPDPVPPQPSAPVEVALDSVAPGPSTPPSTADEPSPGPLPAPETGSTVEHSTSQSVPVEASGPVVSRAADGAGERVSEHEQRRAAVVQRRLPERPSLPELPLVGGPGARRARIGTPLTASLDVQRDTSAQPVATTTAAAPAVSWAAPVGAVPAVVAGPGSPGSALPAWSPTEDRPSVQRAVQDSGPEPGAQRGLLDASAPAPASAEVPVVHGRYPDADVAQRADEAVAPVVGQDPLAPVAAADSGSRSAEPAPPVGPTDPELTLPSAPRAVVPSLGTTGSAGDAPGAAPTQDLSVTEALHPTSVAGSAVPTVPTLGAGLPVQRQDDSPRTAVADVPSGLPSAGDRLPERPLAPGEPVSRQVQRASGAGPERPTAAPTAAELRPVAQVVVAAAHSGPLLQRATPLPPAPGTAADLPDGPSTADGPPPDQDHGARAGAGLALAPLLGERSLPTRLSREVTGPAGRATAAGATTATGGRAPAVQRADATTAPAAPQGGARAATETPALELPVLGATAAVPERTGAPVVHVPAVGADPRPDARGSTPAGGRLAPVQRATGQHPASVQRRAAPPAADPGAAAVAAGVAVPDGDGAVLFLPPVLRAESGRGSDGLHPTNGAAPSGSGVPAPAVQRQDALPVEAAPSEAATPATPPASPSPETPAAGLPDLDELARRLFDPLSDRLRAELRLDRERAGVATDLRH